MQKISNCFQNKLIYHLLLSLPPGVIRFTESFHNRFPVEHYLDLYDQAAYDIQGQLTANATGSPSQPNIIIGKKSNSYIYIN